MIEINRTFHGDGLPEHEPMFEAGQLVRHRRYGYRGVIVSADGHCRADPLWYMSNQTQPERNQPWYHVLVHGGATCTYVAECNLAEDPSGDPVEHPLVEEFFEAFEDGRYRRNARPWID